jgi:hypothetical protein
MGFFSLAFLFFAYRSMESMKAAEKLLEAVDVAVAENEKPPGWCILCRSLPINLETLIAPADLCLHHIQKYRGCN